MKTWQLLKKNPELFQRYFVKEYIIKACRKFFEHRNYHELESPIITSALPQERYLDVLETDIELKDRKEKAYIIPTTETFNKKILAAGLGEHFVITKVARGLEEIGPNHSPEFTMLEWYHLNANYKDIMNDTEELFIFIKKFVDLALNTPKEKLNKILELPFETIDQFSTELKLRFNGQEIDISEGWDRISIPEALKKIAGVKLEDIQTQKDIYNFAKAKGYQVSENDDWQIIFEMIFASEIEPAFNPNKPTFVYNYPKQLCPLTKTNDENPLVCEKVELYIAGKELANGYTELLDGDEQEKRFLEEREARKNLGLKDVKMDYDLVDALKSGMPNVAGIGMGLDRVAMIFADARNISEINYFPASEMFE